MTEMTRKILKWLFAVFMIAIALIEIYFCLTQSASVSLGYFFLMSIGAAYTTCVAILSVLWALGKIGR